jgi:hypothetical protein
MSLCIGIQAKDFATPPLGTRCDTELFSIYILFHPDVLVTIYSLMIPHEVINKSKIDAITELHRDRTNGK